MPRKVLQESYTHAQPKWTEEIHLKEKVEEGLGLDTGITSINVMLAEVHGSRYVFSGFNRKLWPELQYFFWNSITESCDRITNPLGKDKIIEQIKNDIKKVTVEEYDEEDDVEDDDGSTELAERG
ncbi:hypothetical protein F5887DRAFT_916011 [Amanita rubescens]|nr:hypothetical protein F5887DRAFT_916011 [Amanita rubescens]